MLFGRLTQRLFFLCTIIASIISSCKRSDSLPISFVSPTEGARVVSGESVILKTNVEPGKFDSIKYLVDNELVGSRRDTQGVKFSTSGYPFGGRLLTAIIYAGTDSTEITSNIQLLPSKAPSKYSYEVVNTFPHDTSSYTQGLEYHDGILFESDGMYGESSLRKVDLKTGRVLQKVDIPAQTFAEGITVIGDKIIMLTWQERIGFVYDKNSLSKVSEFPHNSGTGEGWGLAFDGNHILSTDGSNIIYLLDKNTYQREGIIQVYDSKGPVDSLNELEYIDGKIYANIYQQDRIVIIDPKTGGVEAEINLQDLAPYADRLETGYVLNGIAWDAQGRRLFVTGKKWNKLFEIKVNKPGATVASNL
nr:glutaminyl-peptide cyclotransferase [Pedobacter mongoliensis]